MIQEASQPVEIIIACHSPKRRIDRAVESVVRDNGEAASATVVCHNIAIEAISQRIPEGIRGRVKFLELHDGIRSPSGPFMHGIDRADASWVGIMGSDDFYEPGALSRMLSLADSHDAVMPRMRHDTGQSVRTPPARPLHSGRRDAVRDRLYYRSAPLGLMRREFIMNRGLSLDAGLQVGEDLHLSTLLWSTASVAVQRTGPAYVIGSDAEDRMTMSLPPISVELRHIETVWSEDCLAQLSSAQLTALGTKYLRIHIFGAAYYRGLAQSWQEGDRETLASAAKCVLEAAPLAAAPLSRADRDLLDSLLDVSVPDDRVGELAQARRKFGRPATLFTRSVKHVLHREAPLRFIAASALVP